MLDVLRRRAESCEPNRARAVTAYLRDAGTVVPSYARSSAGRRGAPRGGHPANAERRRNFATRFRQPDATEKAVQEANKRMRQAVHDGLPEEGLARGPLMIAAEHLAPQLQEAHGLRGEEHRAAIIAYLMGAWGELAHLFPGHPDVPGYEEWREASRQRVQAAAG